ncbi:hypothetical protein THAOC_27626, partial [Thalassiosira oceanica]
GAGIPDGGSASDPPVRCERCVVCNPGRDPHDAREPAGSAREAPYDGVGRAPPAGVERPRPVPDRRRGIRADGTAPLPPSPRPDDGPDMDKDDVRSLLTEIRQRYSREGADAASHGLSSAPSFQSSASSLAPSSASSRLSDVRSRRSPWSGVRPAFVRPGDHLGASPGRTRPRPALGDGRGAPEPVQGVPQGVEGWARRRDGRRRRGDALRGEGGHGMLSRHERGKDAEATFAVSPCSEKCGSLRR